jgi:hypothetical protein
MMAHRSRLLLAALALGAFACPIAAVAEEGGEIIRLTPQQQAEVLDSASEKASDATLTGGGGDRLIHGEIGAMIGTGGARGVFGTAAIPLGENGGAIISFEQSRYGRVR